VHEAEIRVHLAALVVAVLKSSLEGKFDAAEALYEWSEEYLDLDVEEFRETLDVEEV
jgi:hypothetical protein